MVKIDSFLAFMLIHFLVRTLQKYNFVFFLPMKPWKIHPLIYDTLTKLQKFSVQSWGPNLPWNKKVIDWFEFLLHLGYMTLIFGSSKWCQNGSWWNGIIVRPRSESKSFVFLVFLGYTANIYMYKTIQARVNTVAIPTTGKSCSLYWKLLKPLWVIYQ